MSQIKAIIFDMDGVLIDAKEWHYDALNQALALFGYKIRRFEHVAKFDGLPTRKKLRLLTEQRGFPDSLHDFVNRMKQIYTLRIAEKTCRPDPGQQDALSRLRRDGYQLGVASNSIRATVDALMRAAGLADFLSFTLSNQDVLHPKPHPEIYIKAIQLANVQPHQCVVVEDNPYGVRAASRAGARVLTVEHVSDVTYDNITQFIQGLGAAKPGQREAA